MRDTAEILIGEYRYSRFKKYRIESDLYQAAGAFEFELYPDPAFRVNPGSHAKVYVNGFLEMTGIIDKVSTTYDTAGRSVNVSGRDLMGLVVDSSCEEWRTMSNSNLVKAAEKLLKNVPFINRLSIEADETATRRDAKKPFLQPAPGDKIFDVLKEAAASRGVVFYVRADGSLCFRKPAGSGAVAMNISRRNGEPNTYIIRGERTRDYSERYSKYTVLTQEQGLDEDSPPWINAKASVEDRDVPVYKPFVEALQEDSGSVKKRADMLLEQHRAQSDAVKYTLMGHSQGVYNWAINELVRVDDDELDVHRVLLVYSRAFEMSRQGISTELTLGEAGLVL
jgi:prophage tail gpP-like protein